MKTQIQWIPTSLYLMVILIWLNGNIAIFLKENASITTIWLFKILAVYSTLLIMITLYYWIIKNELKVEREKKNGQRK